MKKLWNISIIVVILVIVYLSIGFSFHRDFFVSLAQWRLGNRTIEEDDIKYTLLTYNNIYMDLYASDGETLRLNDFPTIKKLRHEVYRDLDFLRANNLLLVYDMADMTFMDIKRPAPAFAEATAYEEWNYLYQHNDTRTVARPLKGMAQGFKYIMQKNKGQWVIVDFIPVKVTAPKKDEFLY